MCARVESARGAGELSLHAYECQTKILQAICELDDSQQPGAKDGTGA